MNRRVLVTLLLAGAATLLLAAPAAAPAQTPGADLRFDDGRSVYKRRLRPPEAPEKVDWEARVTQLLREEPGDVVITAVGDTILNEQVSTVKDPARQQLFRILQEADLAYGNLEFSLNRHPESQRTFYNFRADPEFAWELAALGINLVGMANNHALDFGPEGLKDCLTALDRADITHAGAGLTLAAARAPGVTGVQSRKTKFALLSYMRYWTAKYRCVDPNAPCLATIDPAVVLVAKDGGATGGPTEGVPARDPAGGVPAGRTVEAVEGPLEGDVKAMEDDVVLAKRHQDVVIVALHNHDRSHHRAFGVQDTTPPNDEIMYRRAIDAGADLVIGTGPHVLRGIEVYKGKPILYSLADFVYQYRTPGRIPVDLIHQRDGEIERPANVSAFDRRDPPQVMEGVLARFTLNGGRLKRLELIPVSIDDEGPLYGVPRLARDARAHEIIVNLQRLSAPYGTRLVDQGWYATVEPGDTTPR